jgi:hypothetical protein
MLRRRGSAKLHWQGHLPVAAKQLGSGLHPFAGMRSEIPTVDVRSFFKSDILRTAVALNGQRRADNRLPPFLDELWCLSPIERFEIEPDEIIAVRDALVECPCHVAFNERAIRIALDDEVFGVCSLCGRREEYNGLAQHIGSSGTNRTSAAFPFPSR